MKRILIILIASLTSWAAIAQDDRYYENSNGGGDDVYTSDGYSQQQMDQPASSAQTFYDELDDYGRWVQIPEYGNVWVPLQAGAGFEPYLTNGHWEYTEYGWTWISDFAWGWATFHYGRWYQDPGYGWVWVPGSLWAPAWVAWGQYEGYYCWAPLWPGEYTSTHYGSRDHHWYFTQQGHIADRDVSSQIVNNTVVNHDGGSIDPHIIQISHIGSFDKALYYSGPKLKEVEKEARHDIPRVNIAPAAKPQATTISNGAVSIYRPAIKPTARPTQAPDRGAAPTNVPRSEPSTSQGQQQRDMTAPQRAQPSRQQDWTPPAPAQRVEPTYQHIEANPRQAPQSAPAIRPSAPASPQPAHIEAPTRPAAAPARIGSPRR